MTSPTMKLFLTARGTMLDRNGKQATFVSSRERDLSLEESEEYGQIAHLNDERTINSPLCRLWSDGCIGVIVQMDKEDEEINKKYSFKIHTSFGTGDTIGRKTYQLKPRFDCHTSDKPLIISVEFDGYTNYGNGNSSYSSRHHISHTHHVLKSILYDCRMEAESMQERVEYPNNGYSILSDRVALDDILNGNISPYLEYFGLRRV